MEIEKKMVHGLKKTKYLMINTVKELEEGENVIKGRAKEAIVQERDIFEYVGMVISKSENFKDDTIQLKRKYEVINREISGIREKH